MRLVDIDQCVANMQADSFYVVWNMCVNTQKKVHPITASCT